MKVMQFKSWDFTIMMIGNIHTLTQANQYTIEEMQLNLRKHIQYAIQVINANDGWLDVIKLDIKKMLLTKD
jgi:hypothetical protein